MNRRILIVGGVAAGASAATKARRTDERAEIVVFERGDYVSFANCGLPYYISREIQDRGELMVVSPELFRDRHRIDVRLRHEVIAIDPIRKVVSVLNHETGDTGEEPYDSLVLAPGSKAVIPPIPGIDGSNVFTMRTIPDMDRVDDWILRSEARHATVVGAGYIGIEMAEAFVARGLHVTVVEMLDQVLPVFDPDMAALTEVHLREKGVDVRTSNGVSAFSGEGVAQAVVLEDGTEIPTDLVIVSIGVRPEVDLAKNAGLALGSSGAIAVSATMQTSDPHIWAAGDAVESVHGVTGKPVNIPLAGPANKQGRIAGANAAGASLKMGPVYGTSIVRFGDMTAASTGLNERVAQNEGYDFETALIHATQHAGYYPGAEMVALKVHYERHSGRILGAQSVGRDGVDKRIDVFATALAAQMTVDDVVNLDLAYAPPFGSARDPVVVAGLVAQNQMSGAVRQIRSDELHNLMESGEDFQLIDVGDPAMYANRHLPGAKLIPLATLRDRLDDLDKNRTVVVYCQLGLRAYIASRILAQEGFSVRNLAGGIRAWRFETVRAPVKKQQSTLVDNK